MFSKNQVHFIVITSLDIPQAWSHDSIITKHFISLSPTVNLQITAHPCIMKEVCSWQCVQVIKFFNTKSVLPTLWKFTMSVLKPHSLHITTNSVHKTTNFKNLDFHGFSSDTLDKDNKCTARSSERWESHSATSHPMPLTWVTNGQLHYQYMYKSNLNVLINKYLWGGTLGTVVLHIVWKNINTINFCKFKIP